jgi:hypothetical protein
LCEKKTAKPCGKQSPRRQKTAGAALGSIVAFVWYGAESIQRFGFLGITSEFRLHATRAKARGEKFIWQETLCGLFVHRPYFCLEITLVWRQPSGKSDWIVAVDE